jgi:S1-C subfamily serine protease
LSKSSSIVGRLAACSLVVAGLAHAADPLAPAAPVPPSASAPAAAASDAAATASPAEPPTFQFARVRTSIAGGDKIGTAERGIFCFAGGDMHAQDKLEAAANIQATEAFRREQKAVGLRVFVKELSPFETAQTSKDADYRIGGTLLRLNSKECVYGNNVKGFNEVEVRWDVFSSRQQRVVLSRTTTSRFASESFMEAPNGIGRDFESKAYDAGLHELFTSAEFKALSSGAAAVATAPTPDKLHLAASRGITGDAQQNATELKKSVVTILSDKGTGSGFYIADGYLLTDRHVVGTSRFVKVKLSSGKELVGEVIRQDGPRDIALLKTESAGVVPLRCRTADPLVGENVYAIGSPFGTDLAGTFTRGVLSGMREHESVRYFQSDVAVNPGNSGGPLLDANGNVLGLTEFGIKQSQGLSFFVPIRDALDKIGVVLDEPPATASR